VGILDLIDPKHQNLPIARSLGEGPDYRPDWRFQVWQQYTLQITSARDQSAELESILGMENDPFVRQLLRYHFGRRCVIGRSIQYALRCQATNHQDRAGSLIKAMIVAGRSSRQIADELATDPMSVVTFSKIFWDLTRYRDNRVWLKRLCFRPQHGRPTAEEECEGRWLQIAYMRGWAGLSEVVSSRVPNSERNIKMDVDRFVGCLMARACDFVTNLEAMGIAPSSHDLAMLAIAQRGLEQLGIQISPEDILYRSLPSPEEQREQDKAKELLKGMSPRARQVLARFLDKCKAQAKAEEAAEREK
jgi:hypothetical protein